MKIELTGAEALNLIAILALFENDNKDNGGLDRLTNLSKDLRGRINEELMPILQNYNQAMKDNKAKLEYDRARAMNHGMHPDEEEDEEPNYTKVPNSPDCINTGPIEKPDNYIRGDDPYEED